MTALYPVTQAYIPYNSVYRELVPDTYSSGNKFPKHQKTEQTPPNTNSMQFPVFVYNGMRHIRSDILADFNKVGLIFIRDNRVLLCRKNHSTSKLILPGGCLEPGESVEQCLSREIREELGNVILSDVEYIGTYTDRAASDDTSVEKTVEIKLYKGDIVGNPVASSEIAELVWFGIDSDRTELAPSLINKILPDLINRGLLPWDH